MEKKMNNSKLRALLSIRNFGKALENHYEQMLKIEEDMVELNNNALAIIENHCTQEAKEIFKKNLKEIDNSLIKINQLLKSGKEKVKNKDRSDSSGLWEQFDVALHRLIEMYSTIERTGFEILPEKEHKHWEKDICNFEASILPLLVSHAKTCRTELEMIEKYTPKELTVMTQIILQHIPEDFTFEDADKYEKDYLAAFENYKEEFKSEKNLWDKFLDVLAGGTHQSPSERVMMQRWVEGEKQEL